MRSAFFRVLPNNNRWMILPRGVWNWGKRIGVRSWIVTIRLISLGMLNGPMWHGCQTASGLSFLINFGILWKRRTVSVPGPLICGMM